ncbi:MAG: PcfB family protein [candidate division Zixibacteria bacterium]|nr:PcfB family protein [candidate division Zixibacteria bacterium]
MNQADAADQVVNMGLKGVEVVSNLAGKGALSLATFLIAALKDQKRTKGKTRMQSFNGKPTKVFVIKSSELRRFAEEAKRYGVLYAAVINRKNPDGLCDIVVNANDAAKVNRIAERFELSTVDVEKIREDIKKTRETAKAKGKTAGDEKERATPPAEKEAHTADERTFDEMIKGSDQQKMRQAQPIDVGGRSNPTMAGTAKSNPSAPSSRNRGDSEKASEQRPSIRQQIREIRDERREKAL